MGKNQENIFDDEIDLRNLFFTLWGGKIYIMLISIIICFSCVFLPSICGKKIFC